MISRVPVCTGVVDVFVRTSGRRSAAKPCVIITRLGHRALDVWRGRGRPRPQSGRAQYASSIASLHWGCGRPRLHNRPAKHGQAVCYHHPSRASSPRRLARTGTSTPPVWSSSVRLLLRHCTGVVDVLVRTMSRRSTASRCMLNFRAHSVRMAFFTIHYSLFT